MISYLADGILMIALIITSVWVMKMNSRLQKLRDNHYEFRRIMEQTNLALEGIEVSIDEINVRGQQVLNALGKRIDEARDIVTDIDKMTREVRGQQKELRLEMVAFQEQIAKECTKQIDILKKISEAANEAAKREEQTNPLLNGGDVAAKPGHPPFYRIEDQLPSMLRRVNLKS
ncbi:hypothetical protein SAMN04488056_102181 [Cohaesibacter marisflavi]|uniref:Uncharacterized protein n=1 Tax=Cohaesibacter marisflavi TaxID=655353 RepID=A0A1I5CBM3_9HYPH|nr:hypothetical protein [Cohaesibacter marisflavi]SFN84367.1 hypothetical protein SAMN04488056_102181 [Cohaesibacter marisflavi]